MRPPFLSNGLTGLVGAQPCLADAADIGSGRIIAAGSDQHMDMGTDGGHPLLLAAIMNRPVGDHALRHEMILGKALDQMPPGGRPAGVR